MTDELTKEFKKIDDVLVNLAKELGIEKPSIWTRIRNYIEFFGIQTLFFIILLYLTFWR